MSSYSTTGRFRDIQANITIRTPDLSWSLPAGLGGCWEARLRTWERRWGEGLEASGALSARQAGGKPVLMDLKHKCKS